MELLPLLVAGVIVIAFATVLGPRLGVAGPLLLVAIGIAASFFLPAIAVDPELILVGVLPPLLYSAAVRLPAVEFRRDAVPISGLAVLLVVISSLALGGLFFITIPAVSFPLAVALGAILSPTDAVATSIAKRLGISTRIVTLLEGESLLNDATALVLLRSALAAIAAGFAFGATVGSFLTGTLIAVVIGVLLGNINVWVRRHITDIAASSAIGFAVPFLAYLPTEHLGGSGLVAAVAAGIATGQGSRRFSPQQRVADDVNWRTVELMLEGAVFLIMGLELRDILDKSATDTTGPGLALGLAVAALGVILVVRAVYVAFIVFLQGRRAQGKQRARLMEMNDRLDQIAANPRTQRYPPATRRMANMRDRVARGLNDLDYYQASPLGWRSGVVIVWAGMRGVVTVAAAQTLPTGTPERELLILIAFLVALISLLLQGLTLPWVISWLKIPSSGSNDAAMREAEEDRLSDDLRAAALEALQSPGITDRDGVRLPEEVVRQTVARFSTAAESHDERPSQAFRELTLAIIDAQRTRLAELAHEGAYSSEAIRHAQSRLDADQISIELRTDE